MGEIARVLKRYVARKVFKHLPRIKTTLDTYGHLFEGLDEAAADRLEATFATADVLWN